MGFSTNYYLDKSVSKKAQEIILKNGSSDEKLRLKHEVSGTLLEL